MWNIPGTRVVQVVPTKRWTKKTEKTIVDDQFFSIFFYQCMEKEIG